MEADITGCLHYPIKISNNTSCRILSIPAQLPEQPFGLHALNITAFPADTRLAKIAQPFVQLGQMGYEFVLCWGRFRSTSQMFHCIIQPSLRTQDPSNQEVRTGHGLVILQCHAKILFCLIQPA